MNKRIYNRIYKRHTRLKLKQDNENLNLLDSNLNRIVHNNESTSFNENNSCNNGESISIDTTNCNNNSLFNTSLDNIINNDTRITSSTNSSSSLIINSSVESCMSGVYHYHLCNKSIENSIPESTFRNKLTNLIIENNVTHSFCDGLLNLLNDIGIENLPKTTRTLLQTKYNRSITIKSGVKYYYFGLKNMLLSSLSSYDISIIHSIDEISLNMNVDGLPLFKSTNISVWPILFSINIAPYKVFPSAITLGNKPNNLDFLNETIDELNYILENGLVYENKIIKIKLSCIVCDAPAKAMIKNIFQYNGKYGCDKCTQKSVIVKIGDEKRGRATYPSIDVVARTDFSFRNNVHPEHHKGSTPLIRIISCNMVSSFSSDYMHSVLLGVMRKLLNLWLSRSNNIYKLSQNNINTIDNRILLIKKCVPMYFARKPRSIRELDRWKATEFRLFLLYTGRFILRNILKKDYYKHFLILSNAIHLFICPINSKIPESINLGHNLIKKFIKNGIKLYGHSFPVYNVHTLLHLSDDVRKYGSLDYTSAFRFENFLQVIKKKSREQKILY